MTRTYLSNIRPDWPTARQEELLDRAIPEWRSGAVYRDILPRAGLKSRRSLKERDTNLLRAHGRVNVDEIIWVASLTVLAWNTTDLMAVLMRVAARHEQLQAIAENLLINPANADLDGLKTAFRSALRRFSPAGVPGGEASGKRRSEIAQASVEKMRPYWALPSADYPTTKLCKEFGVSRPTAFLYLGKRKDAQKQHEAGLKVAESNRKRKKRGKDYQDEQA
jgi:hypothetical protein